MSKKIIIKPINLLIAFIAIIGALLIMVNKGDYGLVLLIIAILIAVISKLFKL